MNSLKTNGIANCINKNATHTKDKIKINFFIVLIGKSISLNYNNINI